MNTLIIENKGDLPIYVLAGTIVKGGKQDRQIGQDFIIESKKTVPVDAFCVEHGRWTAERDGVATGGKFQSGQSLVVTSSVRAAAQYKKNQGEVWSKVEAANSAHHKSAASGTFMATIDDPDVAAKRAALAQKASAYLTSVPPPNDVVGLAYAVDGQIKGVRWFSSHTIFELFRQQLTTGAAIDALTIKAQRGNGPPPPVQQAQPSGVVTFVDEVEKQKVVERRQAAANENDYKTSDKGYGSRTMLNVPSPSAPGAPPKPAVSVPISSDYLSQ